MTIDDNWWIQASNGGGSGAAAAAGTSPIPHTSNVSVVGDPLLCTNHHYLVMLAEGENGRSAYEEED
jgi:hypothetical protein